MTPATCPGVHRTQRHPAGTSCSGVVRAPSSGRSPRCGTGSNGGRVTARCWPCSRSGGTRTGSGSSMTYVAPALPTATGGVSVLGHSSPRREHETSKSFRARCPGRSGSYRAARAGDTSGPGAIAPGSTFHLSG